MSRAKGDLAEQRAREYLQKDGYEIVDHNVYSRFGEIDIIASKGGIYHFIEVKSATTYEVAIANITPSKIAKLIKSIESYLKKHAIKSDHQLDALIVTPEHCELIEAITI